MSKPLINAREARRRLINMLLYLVALVVDIIMIVRNVELGRYGWIAVFSLLSVWYVSGFLINGAILYLARRADLNQDIKVKFTDH